MTTILVASVGGTDQPILDAIAAGKPDFVYFLCSASKDGAVGSDESVPARIAPAARLGEDRHAIECVERPDDLREVVEACARIDAAIRSRQPQHVEVVANYTGGTKTMSAGLAAYALRVGWSLQVSAHLTKVTGREVLQSQDPGSVGEAVRAARRWAIRFEQPLVAKGEASPVERSEPGGAAEDGRRTSVVTALELVALSAGASRRTTRETLERRLCDEPSNPMGRRLLMVGDQVVRIGSVGPGGWMVYRELLDIVALQAELAAGGVFLRGALCLGDAGPERDVADGPAVSEALRLCREVAVVPRVLIEPRVLLETERSPDLRADHPTVEEGLEAVQKLLRMDSDGLWLVDYLKAVESEVDEPGEYARLLERHRARIEAHMQAAWRLDGASRPWTWLSTYHNRVIEEAFEDARLSGVERARLRIVPRPPVGYSFPPALVVPEEWRPSAALSLRNEQEGRQALPILLLLDLGSEAQADEQRLIEQIPAEQRGSALILRASQFGAAGTERGVPLDWHASSNAVVKMVQAAREEAENAGAEPRFYVAGRAALPMFVHLGWELSSYPEVTFINHRWNEGVWDVLRLGLRGRPFSDDTRFFSQVSGLEAVNPAEGPIAFLLSTAAPPEKADAPRFMTLQSRTPAAVVRLGTHTWTDARPRRGELNERTVTRAAYEIERAFSRLPALFPNHRGIFLFVKGPASLAFLAGRALTPHLLRYPAVVPGFNGMEGGGYYSAVTLPHQPGRRPAHGQSAALVVILSAPADDGFRSQLETTLAPQQRAGKLRIWHEGLVEPGTETDEAVRARIESAAIVVVLISSALLADDRLMRYAESARVAGKPLFPVQLRAGLLADTPFAGLTLLPRDGTPIASCHDQAVAWRGVHEELLAALGPKPEGVGEVTPAGAGESV